MSARRDMPSFGDALGPLLARLGVADMEVMIELVERWDDLAGPPWSGASSPQILRHRELVVEASTTAAVRMLRYASESLAKRLSDEFGAGTVESVRVVAPER